MEQDKNTEVILQQVQQQLSYPLDYVTQEILKQFIRENSTAQAYPVGSIFISTLSTDPSEQLGYGTWEAFGAGRVLVGQDTDDTDFDTLEETGGEKTHTLTIAEMPSHDHTANYVNTVFYSGGATVSRPVGGANATNPYTDGIAPQGGGEAHNNLQPFIVVSMWKRTA